MTEDVVEDLLRLVRGGNKPSVAARALGVNESTMRSHLARHPQFATQIARAEAVAEASALVIVQRAASSGDWKPAAWFLERRYPERWARPELREQTLVNVDTTALVRGIHEGLGRLAQRWADWRQPDADDPATGYRSPLEDLGDGRVCEVNGVLIDTRTGQPLTSEEAAAYLAKTNSRTIARS